MFFEVLVSLLGKQGVAIHDVNIAETGGVKIDIDFTEHDKVFEDKIAELKKIVDEYRDAESKLYDENNCLKKRISELESFSAQAEQDTTSLVFDLKQRIAELETELDGKESLSQTDIDLSTPLACAESLIENMTHCEKFMIMPERDVQTFSVEELKEIADYLMVYYRHHRDRDTEVQDLSF